MRRQLVPDALPFGGNAARGSGVLGGMTLPTLILFAAGTLLPCVGLWLADEADRLRP